VQRPRDTGTDTRGQADTHIPSLISYTNTQYTQHTHTHIHTYTSEEQNTVSMEQRSPSMVISTTQRISGMRMREGGKGRGVVIKTFDDDTCRLSLRLRLGLGFGSVCRVFMSLFVSLRYRGQAPYGAIQMARRTGSVLACARRTCVLSFFILL
jgi:hypothetical protein